MRLNSIGLGIGTVSPGHTLDVYSAAIATYAARIRNFYGGDAGHGLWVDTRWDTAANYPLRVTTNQGTEELLVVRGDGCVGIGTISPGDMLEVRSGNIGLNFNPNYLSDSYMYAYNRATSAFANLHIQAAATYFDAGSVSVGSAASYAKLSVHDPTIPALQLWHTTGYGWRLSNSASDSIFRLEYMTPGGAYSMPLAATYNGKIGINTSSPTDALEINGGLAVTGSGLGDVAQPAAVNIGMTSGTGYAQAVDWGDSYKPLLLQPWGGNVGIGIAVGGTPSRKLHVVGSIVVDGDEGGVAGAITLSDVNDATLSTGAGSVKLKGTTARNNAGFIKMYVGTTAVWLPYWTDIS
jgi:hypothetical protein